MKNKFFIFFTAMLFLSFFLVRIDRIYADDSSDKVIDDTATVKYEDSAGNTYSSDSSGSNDKVIDDTATIKYEDSAGNTYSDTASASVTESNCDASPSCWFYNCCPKNTTAAPTAAEKAAAEKKAASAVDNSVSKDAAYNNAFKNAQAANAAQANCGTDAAKCAALQAAADQANADLATARAAATDAANAAQEAMAAAGISSGSNSVGSMLFCANGILATTCTAYGGGGTPLVNTGSYGNTINTGSYGGGLPYNAGISAADCGGATNFTKIGGVCFPNSTGLSSAPISLILSNVFSWLMGLFTTFAVMAFIISGIQYLTSTGDEGQLETAKRNAMYALLGVVVGLSGFVIVKAIAAAISGQSYFF